MATFLLRAMQLKISDHDGVPVIKLTGRLDLAGAQDIDLKFTAHTSGQKTSTVVDLSEVPFISSIGIRIFIQNAKALALSEHKLILAAPTEEVATVLNIAGVSENIPVVATVDEALALLR